MSTPPAQNPEQVPDTRVTTVVRARRPKVWVHVIEALFQRSSNTRTGGLRVNCDEAALPCINCAEATRVANVSYHLAVVTHRSGMVVSFPAC